MNLLLQNCKPITGCFELRMRVRALCGTCVANAPQLRGLENMQYSRLVKQSTLRVDLWDHLDVLRENDMGQLLKNYFSGCIVEQCLQDQMCTFCGTSGKEGKSLVATRVVTEALELGKLIFIRIAPEKRKSNTWQSPKLYSDFVFNQTEYKPVAFVVYPMPQVQKQVCSLYVSHCGVWYSYKNNEEVDITKQLPMSRPRLNSVLLKNRVCGVIYSKDFDTVELDVGRLIGGTGRDMLQWNEIQSKVTKPGEAKPSTYSKELLRQMMLDESVSNDTQASEGKCLYTFNYICQKET